eukprot:TRINITY_DN6761_c0_g1_i1.p1 TRINITY_DN6761_c0_g1~~TRINITY_DN6761_c0_g1_i1.p1  ORF type:complete len:392 (+),score=92.73 TRINITY_DN6761_c0_g1_i1:4-1179(+)
MAALRVPVELWVRILRFANYNDHRRCAVVCKQLREAASLVLRSSTAQRAFHAEFESQFPADQLQQACALAQSDITGFQCSVRFATRFAHSTVQVRPFGCSDDTPAGRTSSCGFVSNDFFVSGDDDGSLYVCDLKTDTMAKKTELTGLEVHCVRYCSRSGILVASGSQEMCRVWEVNGSDMSAPWQRLFDLPLDAGDVWRVQFLTPNRLIGCGEYPFVSLWDLVGGELIASYRDDTAETSDMATDLAATNDGIWFTTETGIMGLDMETLQRVHKIPPTKAEAVAITGTEHVIYAGYESGRIVAFDSRTAKAVGKVPDDADRSWMYTLMCNGSMLVSVDDAGEYRAFDMRRAGATVWSYSLPCAHGVVPDIDWVNRRIATPLSENNVGVIQFM